MMTPMGSIQSLLQTHKRPFRSTLIFGPPGSGKGTLGKFLSSAGNHFHLSSGDIFRGLSPESPAGQLFHQYASKGHLLPDEVTVQIGLNYIDGLIATNRYFPSEQLLLLDGIPRTIRQVDLLQSHLQIEKIIVLEVKDPEELIHRIQRRALVEKRTDDLDRKTLLTRLELYEKETSKVLNHFPERLLARFNGSQKPLEVLRDVLVSLSTLFGK
jgi:adenylate kinase